IYHDFGNQFFKLGEEAIIDLSTFTTSGKKKRGLRATLNQLDDLRCTFEILEPPFSKNVFDELKQISDDWLSGSTEMQFSVGHFSEHYISKAPIGVIKDKQNAIIGFCTFMPVNDNSTVSIDLTRWKSDTSLPLMDCLYL